MVRRENVENQPQVLTQEQVVAALEHRCRVVPLPFLSSRARIVGLG